MVLSRKRVLMYKHKSEEIKMAIRESEVRNTYEASNNRGGKELRWNQSGKGNVNSETKLNKITETKLTRIAQLSKENPNIEFKWLMSHYNMNSFVKCFQQLDGKKAVGVDGITKNEYGKNLEENLRNLIERMKNMSYKPQPVKEVMIPKDGQKGKLRPLGISIFEDKIVQLMTGKILESIYEPIFRNCSYGFRPKRSCHTAVKDSREYLFRNHCEVVIDVDIKNFFGTINHRKLIGLLKGKIKDERFLRYTMRMLKAGILNDGNFKVSEEGTPQGNVASPILANVYAHYVIDNWFEDVVKRHVNGKVEMFRYADDIIICCKYEEDAKRIMKAMRNRLAKYSLEMNKEKTKIVRFDKYKNFRGDKQDTFDFLGFTYYLGKSRKGAFIPKVRTAGKRYRIKLIRVNQWCKENRCKYKIKYLWERFISKLRGHIQYYGVSYNIGRVHSFVFKAISIFYKWINRKSQKRAITWEKFYIFMRKFPIPNIEVKHALF
jgi:RNA-directed DNA polymerase